MHILIVDDEPNIVDSLKVILQAEGFDVTSAYSGDEAFEKARVVKPDVIFSDVVMGRMSGIDLAILAKKVFPGCRTILCSGQIVTTALLRAAEARGHHFDVLPKPVHPSVLLGMLENRGTVSGTRVSRHPGSA